MKLEKREITLNEQDTLRDLCQMEELLLHDYASMLTQIDRKQTRNTLLANMQEVAEDLFSLHDLLKSSQESTGIKE